MPRYSFPDRRAVAVDKVEDSVGHASLVKDLCRDDCAQRRDFARFYTTVQPAAGRKLRRDLVEWLVPGHDQAAHADRLPAD